MQIDPRTASALSFPKPRYFAVELERRWICREVPRTRIVSSERITDLYVDGSRLRLREARPLDGGAPMLRLTRKADVDAHTRLITSIYLPQSEFDILAGALKGKHLRKLRHRIDSPPGVMMLVDEFEGELAGLVTAEAEFESVEALRAFPVPDFAAREVTDDARFSGGQLVARGLPALEDGDKRRT